MLIGCRNYRRPEAGVKDESQRTALYWWRLRGTVVELVVVLMDKVCNYGTLQSGSSKSWGMMTVERGPKPELTDHAVRS
jgi:hypothetical protein